MAKKSLHRTNPTHRDCSSVDIIGQDQSILSILNLIEKIKDVDAPVLIEGESGVGKELIARVVHYNSIRKDEPFIMVNCGAIPDNLLESEFFGHEKGAFTGATSRKMGYIKAAANGTVFLDEVDDLPPQLQVKLLHVLQSGEFSPVGSSKSQMANARFTAASKHPLKDLVKSGRFRDDLFYRLNVLRIDIPPLRNRKIDIPLLCDYFLETQGRKLQKKKYTLTPSALDALINYDFPGNVRELENILRRAIVFCEGDSVELEHLSFDVQEYAVSIDPAEIYNDNFPNAKRKVVEDFEKKYLEKKLEQCHGVVLKAAKDAGMYETNFREKMKKYGISADDFKG